MQKIVYSLFTHFVTLVFTLYVCTKSKRMALPPFIFNDETKKNSHGFYLLNAGGRFERFTANPVMLDNHNDDRLIGKWQNLRVEGTLLLADPLFDEGIALGLERKGQVERGFLRGASPGIIIYNAEYRSNLAGGEDLYVTDWEQVEGSTTPVPSNAGALTLKIYTSENQPVPDQDVRLHLDKIVKLSAVTSQSVTPKINNMEKINLTAEAYVALGIGQDADAAALSAAIVKLHRDNTTAKTTITELRAKIDRESKARAEAIVKLAVDAGRIKADEQADFVALAMNNYAQAERILNAIPAKVQLAGAISKIGDNVIPADRRNWTHLKWLKEDPAGLAKIKAEHPDAFEQIRKVRN